MDRFFSVLQTTTSCCKRSKIGLGLGFVWCPTGHCSWSLVFSLYISNISTDIDSEIRLFADDCVCYLLGSKTMVANTIISEEMTQKTMKLQKDIDQLGCWARKWGMRFQPVKCNMMQIKRKRIKKIHASYILEGRSSKMSKTSSILGSLSQMIYDDTRQQCLH